MTQNANETIQPNEAAMIKAVVDATIADQEKNHKPGEVARRAVHTKSHGTVDAEFTVHGGLDAISPVGLFATPATYKAKVRFSNGSPGITKDILPNDRGVAIELSGVPGKKLLPGSEDSDKFNFLLANNETFFIRRLEDYTPIQALLSQGKLLDMIKQYPPEGRMLLGTVLKLIKNLLHISFYSQVCYEFGEGRAVKYALLPRQKDSFLSFPNVFDADYLRHAIEHDLSEGPATFDFCLQYQQSGDPIEDPTVKWNGPFIPVGQLTLLKRTGPLLEATGEELSFNPWRATEPHRPLGWANRARNPVYRADFAWRTAANAKAK
ncbi:MAG: hypothetical protein P4L53_03710 [Candidatus Obscuribacterales bacterium]|nr:hypothetical protein [Candidatus Obscuribacterales bacterium]